MIQNNVNKAIEPLEDDIQVDRIIEYTERNNSDAKNEVAVHAGCNVDLFMKLREEKKLEGLEVDNRCYDNSDFWPKTTYETGSDGTSTVNGIPKKVMLMTKETIVSTPNQYEWMLFCKTSY